MQSKPQIAPAHYSLYIEQKADITEHAVQETWKVRCASESFLSLS